jgi:hypothetical protein
LRFESYTLTRDRVFWVALILIGILSVSFFFFNNRYVGSLQEFGPVDVSSLGGQLPFQLVLKLHCDSADGSYLSDGADIRCQLFVRSKVNPIDQMNFTLRLIDRENYTMHTSVCSVNDISPVQDTSGDCIDSSGSRYFELPSGDYKASIKTFATDGIAVTKAKPVAFRSELHVLSEFEKRIRVSQDGMSLATFFAFLFIIPTTIIGVRHFLREKDDSGPAPSLPSDTLVVRKGQIAAGNKERFLPERRPERKASAKKEIADKLEQEARTALLEHHASLMQGYKTYVLTLAVGSVALIELWHTICPIFYLRLLWTLGLGFIVAGVVYCIARFAYLGKLTAYSLCAAPSTDPQYAKKPLLFRLGKGIQAEALTYRPQGIVAEAWKRVAQFGEIKRNRIKVAFILFGIFCIVAILFWFLSSPYPC